MMQKGSFIGKAFILLVLVVLFVPGLAMAQDYPTRPINLVVGFAPGGSIDTLARVLASKAEKILGQPFVVSNNGGGGGSVAVGIGAKDNPDGYHLQATTSVVLVQLPQLRPVPYKHTDFVPIIQFAEPISGTVVKSDSPWKTFQEFVDYAKKNPGKVNYGTTGVGSQMHMAMEFVRKKEGLQWTHVPYTGSAASMTAILGGHIMAQGGDPSWIPHIKEGTLRLLCIHSEKRMTQFPDVPTLKELGYGYQTIARFIVAAPRQTPKPILKKLEEAFQKAAHEPEFRQAVTQFNYDFSYRSSEETAKFIEEAYDIAGKMIAELNIPKEEEKK